MMIARRSELRSSLPAHVAAIVLTFVWLGTAAATDDRDRLRRARPKQIRSKIVPIHPKLDTGLSQILQDPAPFERAKELGYRTKGDQVQVVVVAKEGKNAEITARLERMGATGVMSAGNLIEAFVSADLITALLADNRVVFIRKPLYLIPNPTTQVRPIEKVGTYTSEGVAAMNADAWHGVGQTGEGTRIAVIDLDFEGANSLVGTDDLPNGRTYFEDFTGQGLEGGEVHGAACAEIVYDIAPGIEELNLYKAQSLIQFVNALDTARARGIHIASASLGALAFGPSDGTGLTADSIDSFVAAGGIISVAAGNHRVAHWQGTWSDTDGDGDLNFSTGFNQNFLTTDGENLISVPAGEQLWVQLVWNQWSAPMTDLDLFLYRWDGESEPTVVASSENFQNGVPGQLPVEDINFETLESGYYGFGINHFSGPTSVEMEAVFMKPGLVPLEDFVQSGSLLVPGDTASAVTVAALDSDSPYSLEYYSSRGPTNGPGGSFAGGYVKPDISGYANVSTVSYGSQAFNGTSAACPHVAGAAALVWSANPSWTNSQVRSYLESNAIDKGPSGKDNDFGYGRLYLGSPAASCTYSISPTSQSFGSSGGSGSFNVTTQSGCTWTASTSKSWIHITGGSSGNGNGTVSYTVDANSSSQRSGTIQAAGKTFNVTQSGAVTSCTYSISPSSRSFDATGGTATVSVSTTSGCSWTAVSNNAWITISGGSSGTGNGTVSYSVSARASTSSRSGTMTIAGKTFSVTQEGASDPPPGEEFTYFSVVARTSGAYDSLWVSSLSLCNLSSVRANAYLTYQYGGGNSVQKVVGVPPKGIVEWLDTAFDLFGVTGDSSGVVEIEVDAPLQVAARTFNSSDIGTFGQSLPGATIDQSMTQGETGTISPVKRTPEFRTNIGFINTGQLSCTVVTTFMDSLGSQIGNQVSVSLAPGQWKQKSGILGKAGIDYAPIASAVMTVDRAGAKVWAYATVIDNATGDPTGLPLTEVH